MNSKEIIITLLLFALVPVCGYAQDTLFLSVRQCRRLALSTDERMRQADGDLETARMNKIEALSAYFPKIAGQLGAMALTPDIDLMGTTLVLKGTYLAGVQLQQPLFAGGKIVAANRMAAIGQECAELTHRRTEAEVADEAEQAYWGYIAVQQKMRTVEAGLRMLDSIGAVVEASVGNQMATEADRLAVEAQTADLRYQQARCATGLELCRLALCNAIGADWGTVVVATDTTVAVRPVLQPTSSIDSLPEVALLERNVAVKRQEQRMALADFLPTAGIGAGYTYVGGIKTEGVTEYNGQQIAYSETMTQGEAYAMVSVSIPLWDWGKSPAHYRKARIELQNAQLELERNRRLLELRAQSSVRALQDAYLRVGAAEAAERSTREQLRVATNKYRASMLTLVDLLEAQTKWQQAMGDLVEARADCKIKESQWRRNTGQSPDTK